MDKIKNIEGVIVMKKAVLNIVCGFALFLSAGLLAGDSSQWLTDYAQATKEAGEKSLPILVDFSGSDWCSWCIKLDEEVFAKKEFKEFAEKNLVLLMLDFPSNKKQSEELKKQNAQLMVKYKVQGFPTVLLLDKNGKELSRLGYMQGGAEAYVKHLKKILQNIKK